MSDSIEAMLKYMETGEVIENPPTRLFEAIDKLERSPKDFLGFYNIVKQYTRHQLTRGNFVPTTEESNEGITITIEDSNGN